MERFLQGAVDIDMLLDKLDLRSEHIEQQALEQPKLLMQAARAQVQYMERVDQLGLQIKNTLADTAVSEREVMEKEQARITDASVTQRVESTDKVIRLRRELAEANKLYEAAKFLVEGFRHRRDALQVVANLANAEYNATRRANAHANADAERGKIREQINKKYKSED